MSDNIVVVTGAARGIGLAIAQTLAERGWLVLAADVAERTSGADDIGAPDDRLVHRHLDVTSEAGWERIVAEASERGRLRGLVNNAGVIDRSGVADTTRDAWASVMDINLGGVFFGMKAAAPAIRDAGGGAIVNIASVAGMIAYRGAAYTASKWAVRGLTRTAASEFASWGIRVNSVVPGLVDSPMAQSDPAFFASHLRSIPVNRAASGADIGRAVAYLLSDDAGYVTGTDLVVDGGFISAGNYLRIARDMA